MFVLSNALAPVEAVSLMIFESPATQFSLMISKPTGVMCAVECMRHPWKQFRL